MLLYFKEIYNYFIIITANYRRNKFPRMLGIYKQLKKKHGFSGLHVSMSRKQFPFLAPGPRRCPNPNKQGVPQDGGDTAGY